MKIFLILKKENEKEEKNPLLYIPNRFFKIVQIEEIKEEEYSKLFYRKEQTEIIDNFIYYTKKYIKRPIYKSLSITDSEAKRASSWKESLGARKTSREKISIEGSILLIKGEIFGIKERNSDWDWYKYNNEIITTNSPSGNQEIRLCKKIKEKDSFVVFSLN